MTIDPALAAAAPSLATFLDAFEDWVEPEIPDCLERIFAYQEERRMARTIPVQRARTAQA